jgi:hypothetical protein
VSESSAVRYQLVILGFRLNAGEPPAKALERVLGMDPQRAKDLTRSFPCVVGATANPEHARIHAERLTQAGAKVEVREQHLGVVPAAAQAPAAPEAPSVSARVPPPPPQPVQRQAVPEEAAPAEAAPAGGYSLGDLVVARPEPVRTSKPAVPSPPVPSPQAAPAVAPSTQTQAPAQKHELPDAFSGMRNYEDEFEEMGQQPAAALEIDGGAMRVIRQDNVAGARASKVMAAKPSWAQRLARLPRRFLTWLMTWVPHTIALCVVVAISAAAVSYGLDPDHVLDDVALSRAQKAAEQLLSPVAAMLPPGTIPSLRSP